MPNQKEVRLREYARLLSARIDDLKGRPDQGPAIRQVADYIPSIIWIAGRDGNVNFCNRRYFDLFGVDHLDWASLLHPDDKLEYIAAWQAAVSTGREFACTGRFRDSAGNYHWLMSRAQLELSEDGRAAYWIGSSAQMIWTNFAPATQVA